MKNRKLKLFARPSVFLLIALAFANCSAVKTASRGEPKEEADFTESPTQTLNAWQVDFEEDFSNYLVGVEPESMFVLDGAYAVREESGQKVLTLPGSPVGDFGFLFGPRVREKTLELEFSFKSERKGRRYPSVAAGLGGVRAYRFRLNPAARKLMVHADDRLLAERPFVWKAGVWWKARFQATALSEDSSVVRLKLWPLTEEEPDSWLFEEESDFAFKGGKCAIWGYPYAGTEIHFDELIIRSKES